MFRIFNLSLGVVDKASEEGPNRSLRYKIKLGRVHVKTVASHIEGCILIDWSMAVLYPACHKPRFSIHFEARTPS